VGWVEGVWGGGVGGGGGGGEGNCVFTKLDSGATIEDGGTS